MVVVVLPTPPFWLHIEITRALPWVVSGGGSGMNGIGRPVGPSGWLGRRGLDDVRLARGTGSGIVSTGASRMASSSAGVGVGAAGSLLAALEGQVHGVSLGLDRVRNRRADQRRHLRGC